MRSFKTKNYTIGCHHVVNDKKGVLGILKIYGNFRKRTPDEFNPLPQTQVVGILKKTSYSLRSQKSVQWNHETKKYIYR